MRAKRSNLSRLDCHVATLLAMTWLRTGITPAAPMSAPPHSSLIAFHLSLSSRSPVLLIKEPFKPWRIDDVEGLFLTGKEVEGQFANPFDNREGLIVGDRLGPYIFHGEIEYEPQPSYLSILFCYLFLVVHVSLCVQPRLSAISGPPSRPF